MRRASQTALLIVVLGTALALAWPGPQSRDDTSPIPGFTWEQVEKILKDDYKKSVEDAKELITLSEDLKEELEKKGYSVVSVKAIRQTEEIERLAKRIRSRLQRF